MKKRHVFFMLISVLIITLTIISDVINYPDHDLYSVEVMENNWYKVTLYEKDGNIIKSYEYPKEPTIKELDNDIIQISENMGANNSYYLFYNSATKIESPIYTNIIKIQDGLVAHMKNNALLINDIFDLKENLNIIERDFSPVAIPESAIINLDIKKGEALLNYYEGNSFSEKEEHISLF